MNGRPDAKGEFEICFTIRWDYYEAIDSSDRDIPSDDPQVEWCIDCNNPSFHREVLDRADVDIDQWVYEKVCDEMGGE